MSKIFYDPIIEIKYIYSEIEQLPLSNADKEEIVQLIEDTLHHHINHRILEVLDEEHHPIYLDHLTRAPHDEEVLKFLKDKVDEIEEHIKQAAEDLKYDLLKIIRETSPAED